jgi:PKD repeat protein
MIGAGTSITAYKTTLTNLKPVADFYARSSSTNSNVAYVNQPVNFFEQSSYNPTSWLWSFPGSNTPTSTQQNPANIIYPTVGVYNVTLVASNSFGSDTLIRSEYLIVTNPQGITNTGEIPGKFLLYQNYPNPFNPLTKISFDIPVETHSNASLRVFDILGREVAILINEQLKPGSYEVEFDGSNLASGTYFYKMVSDNFTEVKKMMLLK